MYPSIYDFVSSWKSAIITVLTLGLRVRLGLGGMSSQTVYLLHGPYPETHILARLGV